MENNLRATRTKNCAASCTNITWSHVIINIKSTKNHLGVFLRMRIWLFLRGILKKTQKRLENCSKVPTI